MTVKVEHRVSGMARRLDDLLNNEKSGANDILGHCEQSLGQNYSEVLLNAHNIRKLQQIALGQENMADAYV
jgi:hypothetical protein